MRKDIVKMEGTKDALGGMIQAITPRLAENGYMVGPVKDLDYGVQIPISKGHWSGNLRIYQKKKSGIKFDYSALRSEEQAEALRELLETGLVGETHNSDKAVTVPYPIIGTDESGKGDYFGPLVCAGIGLDEAGAKVLKQFGVKDSKMLGDGQCLALSVKIQQTFPDHFALVEIPPERYNALYERFRAEGKNLNHLLAWAHSKAVEEILKKHKFETVLVDQFAHESLIQSRIWGPNPDIKVVTFPHAESNMAVAAASVLARAKYLEWLIRYSAEYKMEFPKGATEVVIGAAKKFIQANGRDALKKVAKLHFKTTDVVLGT